MRLLHAASDLEHAKKLSVAYLNAVRLCGLIGSGAVGAGAACKAMGQLDNQLRQYGCNPGGGSVSCHGTIFTITFPTSQTRRIQCC